MHVDVPLIARAFDGGYVIRGALYEFSGQYVELEALKNCHTLFKVITYNSRTAYNRLQIDICALSECFPKGELKRMTGHWKTRGGRCADEENFASKQITRMLMKSNAVETDTTS